MKPSISVDFEVNNLELRNQVVSANKQGSRKKVQTIYYKKNGASTCDAPIIRYTEDIK
jgi:hypothetical protein